MITYSPGLGSQFWFDKNCVFCWPIYMNMILAMGAYACLATLNSVSMTSTYFRVQTCIQQCWNDPLTGMQPTWKHMSRMSICVQIEHAECFLLLPSTHGAGLRCKLPSTLTHEWLELNITWCNQSMPKLPLVTVQLLMQVQISYVLLYRNLRIVSKEN